jgi:hypothetical protein
MKNITSYLLFFCSITLQAQIYTYKDSEKTNEPTPYFVEGDKLYTVSYAAGIPFGSLGNFISGSLFDGITLEARTFRSETFSTGFSVGFNSFRQQLPREVYQLQNGAYSAIQTRFVSTIPVLLQGTYHFSVSSKRFKPYTGAGIGGHIINYGKWDGPYSDEGNKMAVRFGGRPFVGTLIVLGDTFGVNITARYNYVLYQNNELNNLSYAEVSVGIYFLQF